ncbi:isoprenoid synthase domain-containing protein [Auriculariales sp. MPI-PUGE-AT-0066]|nr:isoprenoid synthase domain-containing protein [Auriculariales sp. MPI-PUGE-AT-0066]
MSANLLSLAMLHPFEFSTLIKYKLFYEPKRDVTRPSEYPITGYDRESMKKCWMFLDMTSRSFTTVVKELNGELVRVIALFYLVLRGLDTIEDDMTLPDDVKQPLLANFHRHTVTPGWNFAGSGPNEKDRQLLVEYDCVVTELLLLREEYRAVILDICQKMEYGMGIYAHRAALVAEGKSASHDDIFLADGAEFDLYCHYVAGLVGEGLSRLFAASGMEGPYMCEQIALSNSTGMLLQKTNILRDYREDVDDKRYFWPRSFWVKHGFQHQADLKTDTTAGFNPLSPEGKLARQRAMWVLSEMTLDAIRHAEDSLSYLALLRDTSAFTFCAIPQVMAMATLAHCFMNPDVFERNVKIRKAAAVEILMGANNPRSVSLSFSLYAREIRKKASIADPSYERICAATARIETWVERHFPTTMYASPVALAVGAAAAAIAIKTIGTI